ncbi:type III toxin-antitoxin system ToxN/AbiQ family toxin [Comamonas sp. CMM01]|nr:type III toxin-antitoxin system ToxN/AbiQ family toxin [Comamonas sp. CMM01]
MRLYTISDRYLSHLRQIDSKVPQAHGATYVVQKPYLGVVLTVDGHDFLAPLSSPKPWHDKIKSSELTIFKIHERTNENNKLGIIALKFMVPVLPTVIAELDIAGQAPDYAHLLNMQYEYIKTKWGKIQSRADKLYDHVVTDPKPYLQGSTCDFANLINHTKSYIP